jgi:hypothetical protein
MRVVNAATGEVLRELVLDQPASTSPPEHPQDPPALPEAKQPVDPRSVGSPVRDVWRHHTGGPRGTRTHNPRIKSPLPGAD